MAEIKSQVRISYRVELTLTEQEAIALDAIAGYGPEAFLKKFKAEMGAHYITRKNADECLKDLFASIDSQIGPALSRIEKIRKEF